MAKKSMLEREKKRELAVLKYAEKRQALKKPATGKLFPSSRATLPQHACTTVAN